MQILKEETIDWKTIDKQRLQNRIDSIDTEIADLERKRGKYTQNLAFMINA